MVKKVLPIAVGSGIGVTIGGTILPRLLNPHWYNSSYPPLWLQAMTSFAAAFTGGFLVGLLIFWIISKLRQP